MYSKHKQFYLLVVIVHVIVYDSIETQPFVIIDPITSTNVVFHVETKESAEIFLVILICLIGFYFLNLGYHLKF